jgi:hypothetical protein
VTAFSQSDTASTTKKDTASTTLPKRVTIEVIKDIIRGDSLLEEYAYLKKNFYLLSYTVSLKDSIIGMQRESIEVYKQNEVLFNRTIFLKDKEIKEYKDLSTSLQKDFKKEKRKRTVLEIAVGVAVTAIVLLAVQK